MTEQHSPETSPESVLLSQDPDGSADEALDAVQPEVSNSTERSTTADEVSAEAIDEEPLEEFRRALRAKPGGWFVVQTYSGMENRVRANLESRIGSLNMEDYIFEVVVPTEEVAEIKNGQRRLVKRNRFPGYVLVRMDMTDESWATVLHTPAVTGFVGHSHQPLPLTLGEVERWLDSQTDPER